MLVFNKQQTAGYKKISHQKEIELCFASFQVQGVWLYRNFQTPCHILQIDFLTLAGLKVNLELLQSIVLSDLLKIRVFEHSSLRRHDSFPLYNYNLIISKQNVCTVIYSNKLYYIVY